MRKPPRLASPFYLPIATLLLMALAAESIAQDVKQWHTKTLSFIGPETSETATPNPFTDYRLTVTFKHGVHKQVVRGFYAADGNAAQTSATSGNVWRVRFAPDRVGQWSYSAELRGGEGIATRFDVNAGTKVEIENATGKFEALSLDNERQKPNKLDFRNRGRLTINDGYLRFGKKGTRFLKAGADSPENLLAFVDFDDTYRTSGKSRGNESDPGVKLHHFPTHVADFNTGDPTWKDGKGKGLIGAVNYLSSTGMNAVYFLTLNINGDGKDVWPYLTPDDFTRFDCSKLDQWEIVFEHMQRQGILMHVVVQETENEKLLDDGDTGPLRQLYFRELIARFAHHPALVWNLGEENGPASFSPEGQNSVQQKAMASFLKKADPYRNTVVIHTHSTSRAKEHLLPALVGHKPLDGVSFQIDHPDHVHAEIIKWKRKTKDSGHPWLITMDEIGAWDVGVVPDSVDPDHNGIRNKVLWGSLMAGAGGVEWYFGALQPHNDLNSEDWRQRAHMWAQTKVAIDFFEQQLPYWEMQPEDALTEAKDDYCFAQVGSVYAIYLPPSGEERMPAKLKLPSGSFSVSWYNPRLGGALQDGTVTELTPTSESDYHSIGLPPAETGLDWVALVKRGD